MEAGLKDPPNDIPTSSMCPSSMQKGICCFRVYGKGMVLINNDIQRDSSSIGEVVPLGVLMSIYREIHIWCFLFKHVSEQQCMVTS